MTPPAPVPAPVARWTRTLDRPTSGVTAVPGGVLVEGDGRVCRLDAAEGTLDWSVAASRVAAVDDGAVHLVDGRRLLSVDAATGAADWRFDAGADFFHEGVVDGRAILAVEGGAASPATEAGLVGVDAARGVERWRRDRPATPVVSTGAAGLLVTTAGGGDGAVTAVDPADGTTRWARRFDPPATWAAAVPGAPASASVPDPTDRGGAVDADDADAAADADAGSTGGRDGTVLVDVRDGLVALDPTDGATRWTRLGVETTPPAVLPGPGLVVVGDADRGRLVAVDLATGDDRWTVAGVEPRRILAAGDAVVAAGWDGVAGSYAAATGRERWTFDAGAAAATASVVGDLVCLRTDDGRGHAVERDGGRVRWSIGPDGPTTVVGAVAGTLLTVGPEGGVDLLSPATGDPLVRSGASSYAVGPEGLYLAGDRAVEAFGSPPDRP